MRLCPRLPLPVIDQKRSPRRPRFYFNIWARKIEAIKRMFVPKVILYNAMLYPETSRSSWTQASATVPAILLSYYRQLPFTIGTTSPSLTPQLLDPQNRSNEARLEPLPPSLSSKSLPLKPTSLMKSLLHRIALHFIPST
jgi:hypothetical protein